MRTHFFEVRWHPNIEHMLMFFWRCLLVCIWESIFEDLGRFGESFGMPFGSKMGSENEVRKKSEKGWFGEARPRGSGSLKELESSNQKLADGH